MATRKSFTKGNKYAQALKMTKGRGTSCKKGGSKRGCCDRSAVLKAVKRGLSPSAAVAKHCSR